MTSLATQTYEDLLELVTVSVVPPAAATDHAIRKYMAAVTSTQTSASNFPVRIFNQLEDPNIIYLFGGWKSIAEHVSQRAKPKSEEFLLARKEAMDKIQPLGMGHWDTRFELLPETIKSDTENNKVISIGRYKVLSADRLAFDASFAAVKAHLIDFAIPGALTAAWSLEPPTKTEDGQDVDEFLLVVEWPSAEKHASFTTTENGKTFVEGINTFLVGFELKHAKRVELS